MEFESAESSGLKTVDAAICDSPCLLTGVQVIADGTNNATLVLYDNASEAIGKIMFQAVAGIAITGTTYYTKDFTFPVSCKTKCQVGYIYNDFSDFTGGFIYFRSCPGGDFLTNWDYSL